MGGEPELRAAPEALARLMLRYMARVALVGFNDSTAFSAGGRETAAFNAFHQVDGVFDAVFIKNNQEIGSASLEVSLGHLSRDGALYVVEPGSPAAEEGSLGEALLLYAQWAVDSAGEVRYTGISPANSPLANGRVRMYVRADYDPVDHAQRLLTQGRPGLALEVLENVPEELLTTPEARGLVHAGKLPCMLAWDRARGDPGRLNRFARLQDEFYKATTYLPRYRPAYECHCIAWETLGRPDMAHREMAALEHAVPEAASGVNAHAPAPPRAETPLPPPWSGKPMRLLFLVHPKSDYGPDVLYDGLSRVLGHGQVIDFPWKHTLHGHLPETHAHYPCAFDHPGEPWTGTQACEALQAGAFDAVLYADTLQLFDRELAQRVMAAAGDTPVFLVDLWDQCGDYSEAMRQYCGAKQTAGQFKREVLAGLEQAYAPNTVPLPFAYSEAHLPESISFDARDGVFWAGQVQYGARRLKLEWLRDRFGVDIERKFPQEQYSAQLGACSVGLCIFGNGFDSVRYWELPAHGCMLLAERPPIHIPHNFVDGESAVFFDDLADLEAKLDHYLNHPNEARAIAEAGHNHFLKHHTSTARARHLLGWMEHFLEM